MVGVNSHGQTCFFGAALLSNESTRSFVWLFKNFLEAMGGKKQKVMFTDQEAAIINNINEVIPDTHHRLCLWHIHQNALKNLHHVYSSNSEFSKDFNGCIYKAETVEEFQTWWKEMLTKYELHENKWLQSLHEIREKWALVYGREHFCAGMTTTQRSESVNSFLKRYFSKKLILRELVDQYEKSMDDRRDEELYEENRTRKTSPVLFSRWEMLHEASKTYTRRSFEEFQEQYHKIVDLDMIPSVAGENNQTYIVSSLVSGRARTVTYSSPEHTVACSCKKFEFEGIFCAHVLKVLRGINLKSLPSQYYLKRWTRDATKGEVFDARGIPIIVDLDPSFSARYSELSHLALSVAIKCAITKSSSSRAKEEFLQMLRNIECTSSTGNR